VKTDKDGEVIWVKNLDNQASDNFATGLQAPVFANGVLYASGKEERQRVALPMRCSTPPYI